MSEALKALRDTISVLKTAVGHLSVLSATEEGLDEVVVEINDTIKKYRDLVEPVVAPDEAAYDPNMAAASGRLGAHEKKILVVSGSPQHAAAEFNKFLRGLGGIDFETMERNLVSTYMMHVTAQALVVGDVNCVIEYGIIRYFPSVDPAENTKAIHEAWYRRATWLEAEQRAVAGDSFDDGERADFVNRLSPPELVFTEKRLRDLFNTADHAMVGPPPIENFCLGTGHVMLPVETATYIDRVNAATTIGEVSAIIAEATIAAAAGGEPARRRDWNINWSIKCLGADTPEDAVRWFFDKIAEFAKSMDELAQDGGEAEPEEAIYLSLQEDDDAVDTVLYYDLLPDGVFCRMEPDEEEPGNRELFYSVERFDKDIP